MHRVHFPQPGTAATRTYDPQYGLALSDGDFIYGINHRSIIDFMDRPQMQQLVLPPQLLVLMLRDNTH